MTKASIKYGDFTAVQFKPCECSRVTTIQSRSSYFKHPFQERYAQLKLPDGTILEAHKPEGMPGTIREWECDGVESEWLFDLIYLIAKKYNAFE